MNNSNQTTSLNYFTRYLLVSVSLVLLDQISKSWILHNMELYQSIFVVPVFSIVHARNYGAAFGFLNDAGGWQTLFFSVVALGVSLVLIVWLRRVAATERQLSIALALVLGGALGNLIDRVQLHYVVDFLLVHYEGWQFPAFNIADAAISVGAVLLLMDSFGWKIIADRPAHEA
jgi:signal peptidase II